LKPEKWVNTGFSKILNLSFAIVKVLFDFVFLRVFRAKQSLLITCNTNLLMLSLLKNRWGDFHEITSCEF